MQDNIDKEVEEELKSCVSPEGRRSFFLFAGAGSGKTHSLITLLNDIREKWGKLYMLQNRHVAVITYTNAATNEILNRLDYCSLFHVSTIHSFVWNVISPYQTDIKHYYCLNKQTEIDELSTKQDKAKNKITKTYLANEGRLQKLQDQVSKASAIDKFMYNPNGNNLEYNSLNHNEVIKISAQMILGSPLLQKIIVQKYPFLLIDESQDTKKELVDAFFKIQENYAEIFTLGFLGDQKQRIYTDGKENMKDIIPDTWCRPIKRMNFRCSKRIIKLANKIGLSIDEQAEQRARENAPDGHVRIFLICPTEYMDKDAIENDVMERMGNISDDSKWKYPINDVKILALEHLMAARRLGFASLFEAMKKVSKYDMALLQGEVTEFELFSKRIFPIVDSMKTDGTEALVLLKTYSPLLSHEARKNAYKEMQTCKKAVGDLVDLVDKNSSMRIIVQFLLESKLLKVDPIIVEASKLSVEEMESDSDAHEELLAWAKVMDLPIGMFEAMDDYVNRRTRYDTHQGVKGLEFDRVMVIIDDAESRGSLFSYDKLLGVKKQTETDLQNESEGKETSNQRTTRLLYVTCTRAKESLALVMYTTEPEKVKKEVISKEWFDESEIEIIK